MQISVRSDYNYLLEAGALAVKLFRRQAGEEVRLVERSHLFLQDGVDVETRFADYKGFLERIFAQAEPLATQFADLRPLFVGGEGEPGILDGLLAQERATSTREYSLADFQRAGRLALYQMDLLLREAGPTPAELEQVLSQDLSFSEAFRIVENFEMAADQKLLCLRLIQDSAAYYAAVRDLLSQLEAILRQELPAIALYLQDFLQAAAEQGAEKFFHEAVGDYLRLEEMDLAPHRSLEICPAAVNYNGAGFRIPVDPRLGSQLYLGLLFQPLSRLKQKAARRQDIVLGQLKAISDPTRFEILRLLAERSRYTKELAEQLNLTSSTLSHHMASLMGEDLVDFRLKGRRTYYSVRAAELMKLAEALKALARRAADGVED
ncbi:MAG TPA: winged helix-turn-helix transcriptional regulator [Firmicutes bacterium]|nr:winged helix-turn-helix transcriptional regulator [Bacillota bacterium]